MNGQCGRVLEVLADGQSHSVTEIHQRAGTMRLNSRVSELRRHLKEEGQTIVCTRAGGTGPDSYLYTLVPLREAEPSFRDSASRSETQVAPSPPKGPGQEGPSTVAGSGPSFFGSDDLQLELL